LLFLLYFTNQDDSIDTMYDFLKSKYS